MASRAMALRQEPRVLATRVAFSHLGRHVIGGRALSDVGRADGFHEVGKLRLGHWFKSYSRHRMSIDGRRAGGPRAPAAASIIEMNATARARAPHRTCRPPT